MGLVHDDLFGLSQMRDLGCWGRWDSGNCREGDWNVFADIVALCFVCRYGV